MDKAIILAELVHRIRRGDLVPTDETMKAELVFYCNQADRHFKHPIGCTRPLPDHHDHLGTQST